FFAGGLPHAPLGHVAYLELRRLAEQAAALLPYTTDITTHTNNSEFTLRDAVFAEKDEHGSISIHQTADLDTGRGALGGAAEKEASAPRPRRMLEHPAGLLMP
ncbi:MAG: hypothetical protein SNJ54_16915, partial [Anaerolineae bacterium]